MSNMIKVNLYHEYFSEVESGIRWLQRAAL